MRHRIRRVPVMRHPSHEADALRHPIAFAAADDALAGCRRPQIVDPHVERRLVAEAAEFDPDRHARRHVHQADDRPRGEHARFRDSDQFLLPVQPELDPVGAVADIEDAEGAAMADLAGIFGEQPGIEAALGSRPAHAASRAAVSRTRAIMLGMPWVGLELSWFERSRGASAASTSVARISAGLRSCTASRTRATMPLVMAALLSARKWSRPSGFGTG